MKPLHRLLIILGVIALVIIPLLLRPDAEFAGADGIARDTITQIDKSYKPWFNSLIEPASGEIESLLFALQAAIGAAVIFYYLGYQRGRKSTGQTSKSAGQSVNVRN